MRIHVYMYVCPPYRHKTNWNFRTICNCNFALYTIYNFGHKSMSNKFAQTSQCPVLIVVVAVVVGVVGVVAAIRSVLSTFLLLGLPL